MRKFFSMLLLVAVIALMTSPVFASTIPDVTLKSKLVTTSEVLSTGGGWLIYSFKAYASGGTNIHVGLYDTDSLPTTSLAKCKAENGEATQYNISAHDAIGSIPIEMKTGCTVLLDTNAYAIIQYVD